MEHTLTHMSRKDDHHKLTGGGFEIFDALSAHIAVLNEAGTVITTNRAWREFAAVNSAGATCAFEGANYLAVCDRAAREGVRDAAAFSAGIRAVMNKEAAEFSLEYACHSPSAQRWFIGRVTRFPNAAPVRVVIAHEEITARKQAEEKAKRGEEWLMAILEASRDGILVEDEERIAYVNRSYAHLLGYGGPGELIGQHVSVVISAEDERRMLDYGRRRLREKMVPTVYEFRGRRKDGSFIPLEASVSISHVGGRSYITTAIHDIAERKQAEKALHEAYQQLEERVDERTAELAEANRALLAEAAERKAAEAERTDLLRRLVTAQEDDRRRIARELHDHLGQYVSALALGLKQLKDMRVARSASSQHLQQLQDLTDQLGREVHRLAWESRPTTLDDFGLPAALRRYAVEWSERCHIPVDYHSAGLVNDRLPADVETALYRIIQEALNNVLKHARRVGRVSLILEQRTAHVLAIVEDDGCGFDTNMLKVPNFTSQGKLGILGMKERVALIGGEFTIESTPGKGTTLFIRIPTWHRLNANPQEDDSRSDS